MHLFRTTLAVLIIGTLFAGQAYSQAKGADPVTYEEIYDDPETLKKLFIAFQPIYGELWSTNPNVGFGFEANYFLKDKADFRVHIRKAYADRTDFNKFNAMTNSSLENEPFILNHYEAGGSYHFKDFITDGETKMVLYKRNYRGQRWAATVPLSITVPSKLRKIYAARLGGMVFDTSTDIDRIISRQGLTNADIATAEGSIMPDTYIVDGQEQQVNLFGNMLVGGIYAGASMTWFRNVAVDIDKHEPGVDDHMITVYADLIVAPWMNIENLFFQGQEYLIDAIETNPVGFRLGMEGRSNRTLSWGYGGEIGMKPGFKKGGFNVLLKISIPVFATDLDYNVEAFGK